MALLFDSKIFDDWFWSEVNRRLDEKACNWIGYDRLEAKVSSIVSGLPSRRRLVRAKKWARG